MIDEVTTIEQKPNKRNIEYEFDQMSSQEKTWIIEKKCKFSIIELKEKERVTGQQHGNDRVIKLCSEEILNQNLINWAVTRKYE